MFGLVCLFVVYLEIWVRDLEQVKCGIVVRQELLDSILCNTIMDDIGIGGQSVN